MDGWMILYFYISLLATTAAAAAVAAANADTEREIHITGVTMTLPLFACLILVPLC